MDAIKSLEKILSGLIESKAMKKVSEDSCRSILDKVTEKFEDQHAKVQEGALKLIFNCFPIFQFCITDQIGRILIKVRSV